LYLKSLIVDKYLRVCYHDSYC